MFIEDYQEAVVARRLQRSNTDSLTAFDMQYVAFLSALSFIMMARETHEKSYLRCANKSLKDLEKLARHCTEICWVSRINLVKAERDALKGLMEEATRISIEMAEQCGWIHEQALALERSGLFLHEMGHVDQAMDHFEKARDLYEKWGCRVKSAAFKEIMLRHGPGQK